MRRQAFTLIELMVVIAIIGILISLGSYVFATAEARSRDQTRKTDLSRISNALEQYYTDQRYYPEFYAVDASSAPTIPLIFLANYQLADGPSCSGLTSSQIETKRLETEYISALPEDPQHPLTTEQKHFATDTSGNPINNELASCQNAQSDQTGEYLYISGPTHLTNEDATKLAPHHPSTSYALFATLERPTDGDTGVLGTTVNDANDNSLNPLGVNNTSDTPVQPFWNWYTIEGSLYDSPWNIDSNYMITGGSSRAIE